MLSHTKRREQLQPHACLLVKRLLNVALDRVEAARLPAVFAGAITSALGQARRDREDLGRKPEEIAGVFANKRNDLIDFVLFEQIDRIEDDHNLLAPLLYCREERALAFGERPV